MASGCMSQFALTRAEEKQFATWVIRDLKARPAAWAITYDHEERVTIHNKDAKVWVSINYSTILGCPRQAEVDIGGGARRFVISGGKRRAAHKIWRYLHRERHVYGSDSSRALFEHLAAIDRSRVALEGEVIPPRRIGRAAQIFLVLFHRAPTRTLLEAPHAVR